MTGTGQAVDSRRRQRLADVVVVLWVAFWIVAGFLVAGELRDLARLGTTVSRTGAAIVATGEVIADTPIIGPGTSRATAQIRRAGRDAVQSGRESRRSAEDLALLLGLAIAVAPTVPVLALYLPPRVSARRSLPPTD